MTPQLKPGRELDALVAERVTGREPRLSWQVMNEDETASCLTVASLAEGERWLEDHRKRSPGGRFADYHVGAWKLYPNYSTYIASAFEVVAAMREKGWSVQLSINTSAVAWVTFQMPSALLNAICVSGLSLPEAICRAALAALSYESRAGGTLSVEQVAQIWKGKRDA